MHTIDQQRNDLLKPMESIITSLEQHKYSNLRQKIEDMFSEMRSASESALIGCKHRKTIKDCLNCSKERDMLKLVAETGWKELHIQLKKIDDIICMAYQDYRDEDLRSKEPNSKRLSNLDETWKTIRGHIVALVEDGQTDDYKLEILLETLDQPEGREYLQKYVDDTYQLKSSPHVPYKRFLLLQKEIQDYVDTLLNGKDQEEVAAIKSRLEKAFEKLERNFIEL